MQASEYLLMAAFGISAYLIGGLSPSVFVSRHIGGFDVRETGSGNAGTTNILRSMGWGYALIILFLDILKGAAPTLVAALTLKGLAFDIIVPFTGLCAVAGHNFPVYMKFKGGKGVAATLGAAIIIAPLPSLFGVIAAVISIALTRFVSVGSLLGTFVATAVIAFLPWQSNYSLIFAIPALALMCVMHRGNIQRLSRREERKISFSRREKHQP